MPLSQKNNQKRIQFIRSFYYKNVHKASFTLKNMTIFYTITKEISLKSLIKISALLQLIANQRSFFLRSKKSSISSKTRKGAPVGLIVSLRGKTLGVFLSFLVSEIFPNIKNYPSIINKRNLKISTHLSCFLFTISDCLIFPAIKKFYTIFKTCLKLRCVLSYKRKVTKAEVIFNNRYISFPF